jgi:hypothetical protein
VWVDRPLQVRALTAGSDDLADAHKEIRYLQHAMEKGVLARTAMAPMVGGGWTRRAVVYV